MTVCVCIFAGVGVCIIWVSFSFFEFLTKKLASLEKFVGLLKSFLPFLLHVWRISGLYCLCVGTIWHWFNLLLENT